MGIHSLLPTGGSQDVHSDLPQCTFHCPMGNHSLLPTEGSQEPTLSCVKGRPMIPWSSVFSCSPEEIEMSILSCELTRIFVPWASVWSCQLESLKMSTLSCLGARIMIPWASIRSLANAFGHSLLVNAFGMKRYLDCMSRPSYRLWTYDIPNAALAPGQDPRTLVCSILLFAIWL